MHAATSEGFAQRRRLRLAVAAHERLPGARGRGERAGLIPRAGVTMSESGVLLPRERRRGNVRGSRRTGSQFADDGIILGKNFIVKLQLWKLSHGYAIRLPGSLIAKHEGM